MARRLVAPTGPKPTPKPVPKIDWQSGGAESDVFVSMEGMSALVENIQNMPQVGKDAAGYEMADIMAEVIADAKENYVPHLTWRLDESGGSDEYDPKADMDFAQIRGWFGAPPDGVSSGGASISEAAAVGMGLNLQVDPSEYAEIQHENLEFNHPNGGGPKYLERPFIAKLPSIMPRLAAAVGKALGAEGASIANLTEQFTPLFGGRETSASSLGMGEL